MNDSFPLNEPSYSLENAYRVGDEFVVIAKVAVTIIAAGRFLHLNFTCKGNGKTIVSAWKNAKESGQRYIDKLRLAELGA